MTTRAQLRKTALALPEVQENSRGGMPSFTVRGKGFASVSAAGHVQLHLSEAEAREVVEGHAAAELTVRGGVVTGAAVPLADINGMALNHWVRRAWFHRAPRRLADELAGADRADAGAGDLPAAIGRPATRALLGAGVTSLDDLTRRTRAEVAELHGVGPKAVQLLEDALTSDGKAFRAD